MALSFSSLRRKSEWNGLRGVAQLAEHRFPKPGVAGSIPAAPASISVVVQSGLEVDTNQPCGLAWESSR